MTPNLDDAPLSDLERALVAAIAGAILEEFAEEVTTAERSAETSPPILPHEVGR